jgi:hypothetical protein
MVLSSKQLWVTHLSGDDDEVEFARYIMPSGSADTYQSQYKLDNRTVTWDAYNSKLKSFGILVKARNFLVFQVCNLLLASKCWLHADDHYVQLDPGLYLLSASANAHKHACVRHRGTSSQWRK